MSSSDKLLLELYYRRYDEEVHRLEVIDERNRGFLLLYCLVFGFCIICPLMWSLGGLLVLICLGCSIFFGVCSCMPQTIYSTPSVGILEGRVCGEYYGHEWFNVLYEAFSNAIQGNERVGITRLGYCLWGTRFFLLGLAFIIILVVFSYGLPRVWM